MALSDPGDGKEKSMARTQLISPIVEEGQRASRGEAGAIGNDCVQLPCERAGRSTCGGIARTMAMQKMDLVQFASGWDLGRRDRKPMRGNGEPRSKIAPEAGEVCRLVVLGTRVQKRIVASVLSKGRRGLDRPCFVSGWRKAS
jgi:hypothetical protein